MKRTPVVVTGFALSALLGLLDLASLAVPAPADGPPVWVAIVGGILGLITLAAVVPAWRGNRTALLLVVTSRALSILLNIPAFFAGGAGATALTVATAFAVAGLVAVALLAPATRPDQDRVMVTP